MTTVAELAVEPDLDLWAQIDIGPLRLPRRYCPLDPTAKQEWFLRRDELEVFFGGAAGPGKSFGLLMAAAQYLDVRGYNALIVRPVLQEFRKPKALIPVSHDWFGGIGSWNGSDNIWTFPSGSTLSFGYARTVSDLAHFKGPAYGFLGFDELTEFEEQVYRGMSRVLRDPPEIRNGVTVPLRKRSASNPGGRGHSWVKTKFVDPATREKGTVFVPATIHDNPHMNYEEYLLSLAHLDPIDRMRLIDGDWDVSEEGGKFNRHKFVIVPESAVMPAIRRLRYWDLAGTEPHPSNPNPDWTASMFYEVDKAGTFTIRHLVHVRFNDDKVESLVRQVAEADGRGVPVYVEQDPGQAGKAQLSNYKRRVLQGFACYGGLTRINGVNAAKEVRSRPAAAAVGNGLVQIVEGCPHTLEFLDEVAIFPNVGAHDDFVDCFSGAHNAITLKRAGARGSISVPKSRLPGVERTRSDPAI